MSAMKRCKNCGKRIFFDKKGWRDVNPAWKHYGYAQRECAGLLVKYAEPAETGEPGNHGRQASG